MCAGIELDEHGRGIRIYFPNPKAALPVLKRDGTTDLLTWGARGVEYAGAEARVKWPRGGWARLESVKNGRWAQFEPQPVKIPAQRFMEKDADGQSHWFDLAAGEFIQGLVAHAAGERRVYVVTIATPPEHAHIHDRWPRVVKAASA